MTRNKLILPMLIVCFGFSLVAHAELPANVPRIRWSPDPIFSEEGFRLGVILNFDARRFWHYEGKLMMGYASSPMTIMDEECKQNETEEAQKISDVAKRGLALAKINEDCVQMTNPWHFSTLSYKLYKNFGGVSRPVVVYYNRPVWTPVGVFISGSIWALISETLNYVEKIWPVNPALAAPTYFSESIGEQQSPIVNQAMGYIVGHVVKASLDNVVRKTYEIIIQEGERGTNFTLMSVNNADVFDHIVLAMLTGNLVRIGYLELFSPEGYLESKIRGYHTYYRIESVEILPPDQSANPQ